MLWFGDLHHKHWREEPRLLKISVETHGAGGKPDDGPPVPDLACWFDLDWLDVPPIVLTSTEMDGW